MNGVPRGMEYLWGFLPLLERLFPSCVRTLYVFSRDAPPRPPLSPPPGGTGTGPEEKVVLPEEVRGRTSMEKRFAVGRRIPRPVGLLESIFPELTLHKKVVVRGVLPEVESLRSRTSPLSESSP